MKQCINTVEIIDRKILRLSLGGYVAVATATEFDQNKLEPKELNKTKFDVTNKKNINKISLLKKS